MAIIPDEILFGAAISILLYMVREIRRICRQNRRIAHHVGLHDLE